MAIARAASRRASARRARRFQSASSSIGSDSVPFHFSLSRMWASTQTSRSEISSSER